MHNHIISHISLCLFLYVIVFPGNLSSWWYLWDFFFYVIFSFAIWKAFDDQKEAKHPIVFYLSWYEEGSKENAYFTFVFLKDILTKTN